MTEAKDLVADVQDVAIVDDAFEHTDSQFAVVLNTNTVPDAMQQQMLSEGFAVAKIDATEQLTVTFRRITEFA